MLSRRARTQPRFDAGGTATAANQLHIPVPGPTCPCRWERDIGSHPCCSSRWMIMRTRKKEWQRSEHSGRALQYQRQISPTEREASHGTLAVAVAESVGGGDPVDSSDDAHVRTITEVLAQWCVSDRASVDSQPDDGGNDDRCHPGAPRHFLPIAHDYSRPVRQISPQKQHRRCGDVMNRLRKPCPHRR
jgi:hypothetical protein